MSDRGSIAGAESALGRTSGAVARRGAGRLLPARLGEYELFDHIGRGGMADIYRARKEGDFGVVRQVVIKEILPELARSERLGQLLAAEARTASRLEHTNVVRIEDLQLDASTLFIAMEYVDGLDLRDLLRRAARSGSWIPPEIGIRIVIELLKALEYAHKFRFDDGVGIVHRDVSPSNVLLSFEGEVKLCDFGIAKSYDGVESEDVPAVMEGVVEGKAGYMSPEQARGEGLDGRADVFAAGIILWELISGKKLYKAGKGESLFDVARRAETRPLPSVGLKDEETLRAVVGRALQAERDARYPSAAAMLGELESYARGAGLLASPLKLRSYLETFAPSVLEARKKRELATRALSSGPVAILEPVVIAKPAAVEPKPAMPIAEPAPSRAAWALVPLLLVFLMLAVSVAMVLAR